MAAKHPGWARCDLDDASLDGRAAHLEPDRSFDDADYWPDVDRDWLGDETSPDTCHEQWVDVAGPDGDGRYANFTYGRSAARAAADFEGRPDDDYLDEHDDLAEYRDGVDFVGQRGDGFLHRHHGDDYLDGHHGDDYYVDDRADGGGDYYLDDRPDVVGRGAQTEWLQPEWHQSEDEAGYAQEEADGAVALYALPYVDDRREDTDGWYGEAEHTAQYGTWQDDFQRLAASLAATADKVLSPVLNRVETTTISWMGRWSDVLARFCLGVIYIWFGALKLIPGLSPAENLVRATVEQISGLLGIPLPVTPVFLLLAVWEVAIGLGIVVERYRRPASLMLLLHLPTTLIPFVLVPDVVWTQPPIGLTLEGQYIVKNLALFASVSAVFAGRSARGRRAAGSEVPALGDPRLRTQH